MADPVSFQFASYRPAAVLRVTGEDALTFLQGQFTQELRPAEGRRAAYGLWLNQKGKVLADSWVLHDRGAWWVVSVNSPAAVVRERLEAYIIADDVLVEDVTIGWQGWALIGDHSEMELRCAGIEIPCTGSWAGDGAFLFEGRRSGQKSWEWLLPAEASRPAVLSLPAAREIGAGALERERILAKLPAVPTDIGPGELPNEGGLEVAAISYTKGCYLGQEVIARLKSMGQVRRTLVRVQSAAGVIPTAPAPLYVGPRKVGELRSVAPAEAGVGYVGLALVTLMHFEPARPLSLVENGEGDIFALEDGA